VGVIVLLSNSHNKRRTPLLVGAALVAGPGGEWLGASPGWALERHRAAAVDNRVRKVNAVYGLRFYTLDGGKLG
jgi:hypothetical protein